MRGFFLSKNKETKYLITLSEYLHTKKFLLILLVKIPPPKKKQKKTPFFTVGTDWYHKIPNSEWTAYVKVDARVYCSVVYIKQTYMY